jgi:hypothetical protein
VEGGDWFGVWRGTSVDVTKVWVMLFGGVRFGDPWRRRGAWLPRGFGLPERRRKNTRETTSSPLACIHLDRPLTSSVDYCPRL